MTIDKVKNKGYTAYMLTQRHIAEKAFKHGVHDFFHGELKEVDIPAPLVEMLSKRATAILAGNQEYADKVSSKLLQMGYHTKDEFEDNVLVASGLCITIQASNPYTPGTMYYKEWERGFSIGFKMNNNRNKEKNVRKNQKRK